MTSASSPSTESRGSPKLTARTFAKFVLLAVLLIIAWVLWSGLFKPLLLALGAFSCALTVYVGKRMGYFDKELFAFRYDHRLIGFWIWLGGEVIRSTMEVIRIVLAPTLRIHPRVVEINTGDFGPVDQTLLGNSITLTPGTLTIDVQDDRMLVHALTEEGAQALEEGTMMKRVAALRGG